MATSENLHRLKYLLQWVEANGVRGKNNAAYGFRDYVKPPASKHRSAVSQWHGTRPSTPAGTFEGQYEDFELDAQAMGRASLLEAELETRYAERNGFWVSPKVSQAITGALEDCRREDVKKCAFLTLSGPQHFGEAINYMNLALRITDVSHQVVVGQSGNTIYFFKCSEDEVLERLSALKNVKRVPTPRKVLVKMVALRMKNLLDAIRTENETRARRRKYDEEQSSKSQNWVKSGLPDLPIPELPTSEACLDVANMDVLKNLYDAQKACKEMQVVLRKEGVDEEVVALAWNAVMVGEVLTS